MSFSSFSMPQSPQTPQFDVSTMQSLRSQAESALSGWDTTPAPPAASQSQSTPMPPPSARIKRGRGAVAVVANKRSRTATVSQTPAPSVEAVEVLEGDAPSVLRWTPDMEEGFLDMLVTLVETGRRVDNGFKKPQWHQMIEAVQEAAPADMRQLVNYSRMRSKYQSWRTDWLAWNAMVNLSGWSVDAETGCPTADQETVNTYLDAHPNSKKFVTMPLRYAERLDRIFEGTGATGKRARGLRDAERRAAADGDIESSFSDADFAESANIDTPESRGSSRAPSVGRAARPAAGGRSTQLSFQFDSFNTTFQQMVAGSQTESVLQRAVQFVFSSALDFDENQRQDAVVVLTASRAEILMSAPAEARQGVLERLMKAAEPREASVSL